MATTLKRRRLLLSSTDFLYCVQGKSLSRLSLPLSSALQSTGRCLLDAE